MLQKEISANKIRTMLKRAVFPVIGIASTLWFLIRVIPKPSRATYPCMKVAYPIASTFVTYLLSLSLTVFSLQKARKFALQQRNTVALLFVFIMMFSGFWFFSHSEMSIADYSDKYSQVYVPNDPIGTAAGILPGRVVWAWNPDATNENQTGTDDGKIPVSEDDDYYFLEKNNDQTIIDDMMDKTVLSLTGESDVAKAWEAMFKFHNKKKSAVENSYQPGEKIFIKINATSILQGDGGQDWSTWEPAELTKYKPAWQAHPDIVETTPQVVLAVLRQLIDEAGVQQEDIYIGDPMKNVYKHLFDYWKSKFPNVNVLGNDILFNGLDLVDMGRIPVQATSSDVIFYSDKGTVMDGAVSDKLYTIHEEAAYLINIASLKAHAAAGITLCAKNHFGSQSRENASHLHKGLVGVENDKPYRTDYGMYRVQVDLMGHRLLGGNTMLFLVDGLYSAVEGWTDANPVKWEMAPFNGDFTNSIFASLDPVALESVCFDFLRTEYNGPEVEFNRPNMGGVDDYLRQAADSSNWPVDIVYDPENDGIPMTSLGVYEHWNNPEDKEYSRNLGDTLGIELVPIFKEATAITEKAEGQMPQSFLLKQNYPNPFNGSTRINYALPEAAQISLQIFNLNGREIQTLKSGHQTAGPHTVIWDGTDRSHAFVASGIYIYRLKAFMEGKSVVQSKRLLLIK